MPEKLQMSVIRKKACSYFFQECGKKDRTTNHLRVAITEEMHSQQKEREGVAASKYKRVPGKLRCVNFLQE